MVLEKIIDIFKSNGCMLLPSWLFVKMYAEKRNKFVEEEFQSIFAINCGLSSLIFSIIDYSMIREGLV